MMDQAQKSLERRVHGSCDKHESGTYERSNRAVQSALSNRATEQPRHPRSGREREPSVPSTPMPSRAARLRQLLQRPTCHVMPCCFDALSARLIEQAGFELTFMSGFGVAATRMGGPDTGLLSYGEMVDQGRSICEAVSLPVIGDADTGYGNAINVKRTVRGYAAAGFAAIMLEDQVAPKRCGHTLGKQVVSRHDAFQRIQAAVDAREQGADILILARTDARHPHGLDEAIARARGFAEIGADIIFVEAPHSIEEMARIAAEVPAIHMANMVEGGLTPMCSTEDLHRSGFRIVAYPLTLLSAAMRAMIIALERLRIGRTAPDELLPFDELQRRVGFDVYDAESRRYATQDR